MHVALVSMPHSGQVTPECHVAVGRDGLGGKRRLVAALAPRQGMSRWPSRPLPLTLLGCKNRTA